MTSRDPDIDRLTELLGKCLGRIDEEAFRLQNDDADFDAADRIDDETAQLQEIVESLVEAADVCDEAVLDDVVADTVDRCLQDAGKPIMMRRKLGCSGTHVACSASMVAVSVQRALTLTLETMSAGDELCVTTRTEGDQVLVEIRSDDAAGNNLNERGETLRDFVGETGGNCALGSNQGQGVFLVLEWPNAQTSDAGRHL